MCEYVVSTSCCCTSCPAAAVVATTELAVFLRYDNPYIDTAKLKPNDMSFVIFF